MHYFKLSIMITLMGGIAAFLWGGFQALSLTLMLSILEISLSFDNAVINASVLKKMDRIWQKRFLTWGIIIAVFVIRLILPIFIVAMVANLNFLEVIHLSFEQPAEYSKHLLDAKVSIASFGGIFLWMVFLSFMLDEHRTLHWLHPVEKFFKALGKFDTPGRFVPLIALLTLLVFQAMVPESKRFESLIAGVIGILLFVLLQSLTYFLNKLKSKLLSSAARKQKKWGVLSLSGINLGLIQFLYLEILDASFSLDGVIGAFAITDDIIIILLGLMIGAVFVRSITIFMVHRGTLDKYMYLEHGAHYAIGALAVIMFLSIQFEIPEIVIGLIGVIIIGLSLFSSIRHNRRHQP